MLGAASDLLRSTTSSLLQDADPNGHREDHSPSRSTLYEVRKFVGIEKAKILALLIVVGCACYHGLLHYKYGNDSCQWLLTDGHFQGYDEWQPYGCMMHKYSKSDAKNCMHYISYWGGRTHIAFVGDSRIRQLYFDFISLLSTEEIKRHKAHSDLHFSNEKLNLLVEFRWQPYVSDSMIDVYEKWLQVAPGVRPKVVITGSATWTIKNSNGSMAAAKSFGANLTQLVPYFEKLKSSSKIIWMLQDPVVEDKLSSNRSMITNFQVNMFNSIAYRILLVSSVQMWSSSRLLAQGFTGEMTDGIHLGKAALLWDSQILLNIYCNDHMNFNDGTCCTSTEPPSVMQIVLVIIFLVSFVIAVAMWAWRTHRASANGRLSQSPSGSALNATVSTMSAPPSMQHSSAISQPTGSDEVLYNDWLYEVTTCIARLGIVILYFFICDRTTFFMKENKYYTNISFFLPFSYLMILGLFFTENTKQPSILSREQTDEWKGWMQLVILIYHLTGASKILPIYMQIRVMVSSYLFLSGYGHFCFFFNKGDFSIHRLLTVLVRFNFLVVVLCLVMNRPYQFYYFVPLVSFWFVVIYVTVAIWPRITTSSVESVPMHYLFMLLKFAVLAVAITLTYSSEVFFEKIFLSHPFKSLFVSADDSIFDWRFRWQLDRYSTLYGMGFAFGLVVAKKFRVFDELQAGQTMLARSFFWIATILSASGLIGYTIFTNVCKSKEQCNEVHSYIAFVPVVSYIFLRNVHTWLRAKYSVFFAWFGQISLELFVAQYHIWLAADTHGLLVLVPSNPVMNIIVSSFVFVCAAHEIHSVTTRLLPYLVPADWRRLARNVVLGVAVGLPIAFARGAVTF